MIDMLEYLGKFIEKRPWLVVITVLIITIGMSTLLPQIEMKTEFEDFMPEEEVIKASDRVTEYFGKNIQTMFLFLEKQKAESILSPEVIREIYFVEKSIKDTKEVNGTVSIITFINQICQVEYGKTIEQCSNEEIDTVIYDIISEKIPKKITFFENDDENEEIDYSIFPRLFKGRSIDSIDIKNGNAEYNSEKVTFNIEVYDLSEIESELKIPISTINVYEWYVDFDNELPIFEDIDIDYKIAAHIEPKHPLWVLGDGLFKNIKNLFENFRNEELFNTYEKSVYLWLKPPGQNMSFPIPLETGEINLNRETNEIRISVSREEIGKYGIATKLSSFQIPAKLSNFEVGTRYYQSSNIMPWKRLEVNSSFLFQKIEGLSKRPILGNIANRLLKRANNEDVSLDDFDEFFNYSNEDIPLDDRIALKDIENSWKDFDKYQDKDSEGKILFIRPDFFDELETGIKGFVSEDYEKNKKPTYSLVLLELNRTKGYERIIEVNKNVIKNINQIDEEKDFIKIKITGDGVITAEINEVTSDANQFIGPTIFIIIFIILLLNFRKISYVILPMVALLIATIWLFGTLVLLGMDFSVMQVALVPLIMGLGVDYAVHLFHNYRVELDKGKKSSEAIINSVKDIGSAMFLAMLTTVIAFMSFFTATVPAIKDFGILLGLGVFYTFITAITILPAFRYILDRNKKAIKPKKLKIFDVSFVMSKLARIILHHNKKILIIMIILSVFLAFNAVNLNTGFDIQQFAPKDTPSIDLFEEISDKFPSSTQTQEYILIEGNVATVETLKGIYNTHYNFRDDTFIAKNPDDTLKTTSIYTVIQDAIKNNQSIATSFNIDNVTGIPKTDNDVKNLFDYLYGKEEAIFDDFNMNDLNIENLQDFNYQKIQMSEISARTKNVLHKNDRGKYDATVIRIYISFKVEEPTSQKFDDTLEVLKNELENDISDYGSATAKVTGTNVITLTITDSLTESQILSTFVSTILAAIVLIIAYKNPVLGLIALIPVGITMIWILGTMYVIGYTLNALTITITSITIGIGIDYSIHATERFRLVADKTGDIEKAMCETISHTGGALLIAALTTACGFGILAFAPIPPQQQFGVILSITIMYSLFTTILILPSLLVGWAKWRRKRKGYIITTNGMKKVKGKWVKTKKENKNEKENSC